VLLHEGEDLAVGVGVVSVGVFGRGRLEEIHAQRAASIAGKC
jgi:hypothetical protein